MKSFNRILVCSVLASLSNVAALRASDAAAPAGYWEGNISLPNRELAVRVEFTRDSASAWQGTIDIPLQGIRGLALKPVKVDGAAVEFALPGLPGEPNFKGKLAADGKTMAGDFIHGGNPMPLELERKTKPPPEVRDETPAQGIAGKGLAGNWRASLKPLPGVELRLSLELVPDTSGKLEGAMISLDQGNARIPLADLTDKDGEVRFETPTVKGGFVGKMNGDGSELAGEWSQGGRAMPLVFKRVPSAKPAGTPSR